MPDDTSSYDAGPDAITKDSVRGNRLVHANLTGNTAEIIRIMNQVIAEGDGPLSRLCMALAADMAVFVSADKTTEEAVFVIDGVLDFYLRDGE